MANGFWASASARHLQRIFTGLPDGLTEANLVALTRDAYPFGERRNHPYKVWLVVSKEWRDAYQKGYRVKAHRPTDGQ